MRHMNVWKLYGTNRMTTGDKLILELGLENFKNVYIEKSIGFSPSIFIVTVDSRHDGRPITTSMVRKVDTSVIYKVLSGFKTEIEQLKFTPLIPLSDYDGTLHTRSVILFRDLSGEYMQKDLLYSESVKVVKGLV